MAVEDVDATTLMPLETPILKVSRPVAACSRCRNAKIKCDGKLPACTSCEKNGRAAECTSTNDQFARGKERSYVSTLETRIDKLQAKLEEARARKPSVVSIPDDDMNASRRQSYQVQEPPTPNTTSKALRRKEATAIDDLVSDFGFLSVNATARDFYGFTTAMSYARLVLWACSKDPLPEGMAQPLPPRYAATALIQHYLNNIFVLLPVFDEASFYASVDNVYSRNSHQAEPLDHWLVRVVLAISSASMSEQRGDQRYMEAIGHVCAALESSEDVLHPGAINSIQAIVLLTEYAMLDPHHFDSWGLIGAASRAMVDLGLHQDPPKGTAMPKGKLELRRRVYHCIYALDRSTSLVQTRAFSFSDDSAKVKVPFGKQASSAPTSPGPSVPQKLWSQSHEHAMHLVELRKLQSRWYSDLFQSGRSRWDEPYPYVWSTCESMRKWFENLPPTTSPNMRAFFELDLLYSYVYVLSPSPRVPAIRPFAQKLIFEYCIQYADLMLRLISDPAYTAPLTFYDAMRVYMTGRQFLDVLQHDLDALMSGSIPPHPEVKPTAAPPPPMPVVPLPPGDTVLRFNIARSIACIKNISESLSRFGIRWGYMSWSQRYQGETSPMLDELNIRLRDLEGTRRQSVWHSGSSGSVGSTQAYQSPPSMQTPPGMPTPPGIPQQPVMSVQQTPPGLPHAHPIHHVSPPQFHQQPIGPVSYNMASFAAGQQAYQQQHQYQQPAYNFNQMPTPAQNAPFTMHQGNAHRPSQQFATWTGYGGIGGQPDMLDEENAVPPDSNPWKT
ncbi:hypothetical protein M409DRAFT_63623 [Zasmidium cellare ATCC 36951]|uniref:Zn(2)-C6 fungal-type domain-containing protein n=1 Tax=Zasmidium cellare ATCC 36951 TaxID=1080233 RepID=A0A6A6CZF6_ZASCE|nr:uncharacterized protein M409DRAFT_63623 [Zasmidium cellare ATCC 36951]KAF2171272.1 hypothetical protein M409DRAFT_63623 [Zasmidium cellare ATCC 36951]